MVQGNPIPGVCIIVLNWNNPTDTIECIRSILKLEYSNLDVIVVDNGSSDDSVSQIQHQFPGIQLIETGENLGYAGGHNYALKTALSGDCRFFLLMNNDTIVAPDMVSHLVGAFTDLPGAGFAAPMILEYYKPELINSIGCILDLIKAEGIHLHSGERMDAQDWVSQSVDFADGSALFFERGLVDVIGMMDEEYFIYYEETDWCMRARKAGYPTITVPKARMWHKVSATMKKASPIVTYYMTRNALRFSKRNLPFWESIKSRAFLILRSCWWILTDLKHGENQLADARLLGIRDFFLSSFGRYDGFQR